MFAAVLTALMTAPVQLPAAPPREDPAAPKLIGRGKDYFLHALPPPWPPGQRVLARLRDQTNPGLLLLHTSIATGEMKVLAAGGDTVSNFAQKNVPDTYRSRIMGVAADKERLYVLRWHSGPSERAVHLHVFRPGTGEEVHALKLEGDAVPDEAPRETAGKGPLRLHPDGVACLGVRFEFKGTRLIKRSSEKK
jgi:hypothetical protein